MSKRKTKQAAGGVFISPHSAGSFISWQLSVTPSYKYKYKDRVNKKAKAVEKIHRGFLSGTMRLGDCTRQIGWDFGDGRDEGVEKIDKAIKELQNFRKKYVEFHEAITISRKQTGYNEEDDYL